MNFRPNIQPRFVVAATALVAVLMVGSALFELRESREELMHLVGEEAISLAESIDRGGANALLSMDRIEALLAERLLNNAFYVARLDSLERLRPGDLASLARANGLFRINLFDRRGNRVLSSHSPDPDHARLPSKNSPAETLAPLLSGTVDRLVIGVKDARHEEGQRFAVAVRRTRPPGGAVVVNIDAAELLEFRRSIGFGKLIRDLGDNSGIRYVALQDDEGILAASGSVRELSSIDEDSVLGRSMNLDTTLSRIIEFNGEEVFEIVKPFTPNGTRTGVLRIALPLDEVRAAESRMNRRMVVLSLVVVVIGALSLIFLMSQQNFRSMERKYASIKTFTGNILAQMRDGVVTVDADDRVTIFNARAADLIGAKTESVENRPLRELTAGPILPLQEIFSRQDGTAEILIERLDGSRRIADVSLSTTRDQSGAVESRTAVLRDLTEARRLEQEARRKEKLSAMGALASGVAHEIRNPLNAIAMIAQRFGKEFLPRTGVREYRALTKVMQEEARRVNGIIRQFLSFARPPKLQPRPLPLSQLIGHVASLFAAQASAKSVLFSSTMEKDAVRHLDLEQMTQALLNVLQNALEATPGGGTITLTGGAATGEIRIVVTDTGKGIPRDQLEKIFNLYYTTKEEGTGLGLSITQQIVGQHGGSIEVSSVEGKGTRFAISLPDELPGAGKSDSRARSARLPVVQVPDRT